MNFETPPTLEPGMGERAIDTAADVSRTLNDITETLQTAVGRLTSAVAAARRPGRPLAILSSIAREAPLASLSIAFLVGIAVARRR